MIDRKGNYLLRDPTASQTGALAKSRCHDDIRVARYDGCGCTGIQTSRPGSMDDRCRCISTPIPRETIADPFVRVCDDRDASSGEQRCLWVQVGLVFSQTHFSTLFVLGDRQARPSTMWYACARSSDCHFLVCVSTHKKSKAKWPHVHLIESGTRCNTSWVLVSNASTHSRQ